jgi:hypothetical protein
MDERVLFMIAFAIRCDRPCDKKPAADLAVRGIPLAHDHPTQLPDAYKNRNSLRNIEATGNFSLFGHGSHPATAGIP